jgi:hypothetical protein
VVRSRSLPAVCPAPRDARRRLPSRGSRGRRFPPCTGTMRRSDGHPAPLEALRVSLVPRSLACFRVFVGSLAGAWLGRSAPTTPGPLLRRSPKPALAPGAKWLAHVPALPLWRHAPRSDPGGVLGARPLPSRTAAFRRMHAGGFPRDPAAGSPCGPRLYQCRVSITRPAASRHPASYPP